MLGTELGATLIIDYILFRFSGITKDIYRSFVFLGPK